MEHVDFMDYVYSSRNVSYANFTYARIVGGIMNWLSNLAQSNRKIDISHDWVVALQVSRIEEVPRGFGEKRKLNEENGSDAHACLCKKVPQYSTRHMYWTFNTKKKRKTKNMHYLVLRLFTNIWHRIRQ